MHPEDFADRQTHVCCVLRVHGIGVKNELVRTADGQDHM